MAVDVFMKRLVCSIIFFQLITSRRQSIVIVQSSDCDYCQETFRSLFE